jgi:hypothetical protein
MYTLTWNSPQVYDRMSEEISFILLKNLGIEQRRSNDPNKGFSAFFFTINIIG